MITNLKSLNRILILINTGLPLIYFGLFIKYNTPMFYTISLIYLLLPILFIVKNKIDDCEIIKYKNQLKSILNIQIFLAVVLIASVILIKYLTKNSSYDDYGTGFIVFFILVLDFVIWVIFVNKLVNLSNIISPEVKKYEN